MQWVRCESAPQNARHQFATRQGIDSALDTRSLIREAEEPPGAVREQMPGLCHADGVQARSQQPRFHQVHLRPATAHTFPIRRCGHDQVSRCGITAPLEGHDTDRRAKQTGTTK